MNIPIQKGLKKMAICALVIILFVQMTPVFATNASMEPVFNGPTEITWIGDYDNFENLFHLESMPV